MIINKLGLNSNKKGARFEIEGDETNIFNYSLQMSSIHDENMHILKIVHI